MPRHIAAPPDTSPPHEPAARLMDLIRTYAANADLPILDRSIGLHHLAHLTNELLNDSLATAKETTDVTWDQLGAAHGVAKNVVQTRAGRARGKEPRSGYRWPKAARRRRDDGERQ